MPNTTTKKGSTSKNTNSSKNALLNSAKGSKSAPRALATKASSWPSHKSTQQQRREAYDGHNTEESDGEQPCPKKRSRHQATLEVEEFIEELEELSDEKVAEDEDMENDLGDKPEEEVSPSLDFRL